MQTQGFREVQAAFAQYRQQFHAAMRAGLTAGAAQVTAYEKREHRWQNRTGAAERQLACTVEAAPRGYALVNRHGVPYGAQLELARQGRYAILQEALRRGWPAALAAAAARAPGRGR